MKHNPDSARNEDEAAQGGDLSDEELMDRYCAGDVAAFNALFTRYQGRLTRFLSQMVGPSTAPDMVQVTFMKVHQNRHRYRVGASLASWVFTIARNTALDHLRSAPRRREKTGIEIDAPAAETGRDIYQDERVKAAVDKLPPDQRQVILLHWFAGLTFEEVGRVVNAKGAAVRVRAHRAYNTLRSVLGEVRVGAQGSDPSGERAP